MPSARPQHEPPHRREGGADAAALARAQDERALPREVAAERAVARIAAKQHGMITMAQLAEAGFSRTQLTRRVAGSRSTSASRAAPQVAGPASGCTPPPPFPRPGVAKLRSVLELLDEPLFTRSEAERRLTALVRSAGLPMPRTNVYRAGWEVDAVWDRERLVVEVDGHKFHSTRAKFERDRRKDADLLLAGYRVIRLTWRRLTKEPDQVVALLAAALARADHERALPR